MKKPLILIALCFAMAAVYGQSIKKGSLVSVHTLTITLEADVTMDQFIDFFENKYLPEFEKLLNCEIHLARGLNREVKDQYGTIWYYNSKAEFNKFWNDDGSSTEAGKSAIESTKKIREKLNELGTASIDATDWEILE